MTVTLAPDVDTKVARALRHLPRTEPPWGRVAAACEAAIRRDPRRWLLIHQRTPHLFDTAEAAVRWWVDCGATGFVRIIDLEAGP